MSFCVSSCASYRVSSCVSFHTMVFRSFLSGYVFCLFSIFRFYFFVFLSSYLFHFLYLCFRLLVRYHHSILFVVSASFPFVHLSLKHIFVMLGSSMDKCTAQRTNKIKATLEKVHEILFLFTHKTKI